MTTLAPPPPPPAAAVPDQPPPPPVEPARRAVTVSARMLPDDIIAGRRLRALKKRIGYGLVLLVLVMTLAYVLSWLQTNSARSDLDAEHARGQQSQQSMTKFAPMLALQQQLATTTTQISTLMSGDVAWSTLLSHVRAASPKGIVVTAMAASLTDPSQAGNATPGGLPVLNETGQDEIGTLGITGTATDKDSVAAFVDALGRVKGLAAPFPATVSGASGVITFNINVLIVKSALSGRYSITPGTGN